MNRRFVFAVKDDEKAPMRHVVKRDLVADRKARKRHKDAGHIVGPVEHRKTNDLYR